MKSARIYIYALCILLNWASSPVYAQRYALLVGINDYPGAFDDLEGAVNDVNALEVALIEHWEFDPKNMVRLLNAEATRAHILQEIKHLISRTQPGDHIFIYFSGHGTSRNDPNNRIPLPHTSGAFVPVDFHFKAAQSEQMETLIIGQRDLLPLLSPLDTGNRQVFVAMDSCYSGNAVRSLGARRGLKPRFVKLNPGVKRSRQAIDLAQCFTCGTRKPIPSYPYQNIVFLAAASDKQVAKDISEWDLSGYPTIDGKPHGAFTNALLHVLTGNYLADTDGDGRITYHELRFSLHDFMQQAQYGHAPQMLPTTAEDHNQLGARSLFENAQRVATEAVVRSVVLRVQLLENYPSLTGLLKEFPGIEQVTVSPDVVIKRARNEILLLSGAGDLIVRWRTPTAETIAKRVAQELWVKKLLKSRNNTAGFNLTLELTDGLSGETAIEGERIHFLVRSEQKAYLLLLDINSEGEVFILYPKSKAEFAPIEASQLMYIPKQKEIIVQKPFGTDQLILFAFPKFPEIIRSLAGHKGLAPDSAKLRELERFLLNKQTQQAHASLRLRTVSQQDLLSSDQP